MLSAALHYASICSYASTLLLCSKLCRHNSPRPIRNVDRCHCPSVQDGRLDKKELGDWVMPEDFDHARAEARHLVYEADINKVYRAISHDSFPPNDTVSPLSAFPPPPSPFCGNAFLTAHSHALVISVCDRTEY